MESLLLAKLLEHNLDGPVGLMRRLEGVVVGSLDNDMMGSSDSSCMDDTSGVFDLSDEPDMSSHHLVEGTDDMAVFGEAVSSHNMEQFMDHSVGMSGGVSDDAVELVDKPVVLHDGVHLVLIHFHITF